MNEYDPEELRKLVESQLDEITGDAEQDFADLDRLLSYTTHVFLTLAKNGLPDHIALALTECYLSTVIEQLRSK